MYWFSKGANVQALLLTHYVAIGHVSLQELEVVNASICSMVNGEPATEWVHCETPDAAACLLVEIEVEATS